MEEKTQGTITKIISDKGFGFISVEGMEKDLFFHISGVLDNMFDSLNEGDSVSFLIEEGPKGLSAVEVERA